jgi:hypothetical protein
MMIRRGQASRECKVCGSHANFRYQIDNDEPGPKRLDIFVCGSCGLAFVGNPLSDDELTLAYDSIDPEKYYETAGTTTVTKVHRAVDDLKPILESLEEIGRASCRERV